MRLAFFAQLQSGSISYWVHFLSMNDRSKSTKTLWNNIWIKGRIDRQDYRVKRSKRIGFAGILLWERENEREEKPPALRLIRYINERIGKAFHSCWFYMLNKFHLVAVKVSLWSGCTKKALYRRALRTSGIRWVWKWWKKLIATVAPALFSFAECPHLFSRYHFLLHRCSRFEFFPSLSVFFCKYKKTSCNGKTGKSLHETWEYGNTFCLSFPFCWILFFILVPSTLVGVENNFQQELSIYFSATLYETYRFFALEYFLFKSSGRKITKISEYSWFLYPERFFVALPSEFRWDFL